MSAVIMSGLALADSIYQNLKTRINYLKAHVEPTLAIVTVGDDEASKVYVRKKLTTCEELGIICNVHHLPADCDPEKFHSLLMSLNRNRTIHGIIVQLPLPDHIPMNMLNAISPAKDVDGLTDFSVGALTKNASCFYHQPCTPAGIMALLKAHNIALDGKHAVIVGRSNLVGRPLAQMLIQQNATVTICHSHTKDLAAHTRQADIIICAVGEPKLITLNMVKQGAVVVDVGINRVNGKLRGDVDFPTLKEWASYITPVPGGVGPMTVAKLMENVVNAAEHRNDTEAYWVLEPSPYAEHEERVDGESHDRYVCSVCRHEAGFECDPDGFAGAQVLSRYCPGCGKTIQKW